MERITGTAPNLSFVDRGLTYLLAGLSTINLVGLVVLMAWRAHYPFELEWIEGATAASTQWILSGHFLYERPSLTFTPLLYNPIYFYLSAAVSALVGPGFLAPRLVSGLATVGCSALIFALVRRETGNRWGALAGAGFYCATFKFTAAWMDVGRADSLLIFWLLLAVYWMRRESGPRGALGGAAILTLAYFTKQSAIPFFVAFGGYYLLESRRAWIVFWPAALGLVAGTAWVLDRLSGGWYSFYTWYVVQQTVLDAVRIRYFWTEDLLGHVPIALMLGIAALTLLGNPFRRSAEGSRSRFYLAFTASAVASSWWNRAAAGAATNTLLPSMACLGLLMGLAIGLPKPLRWSLSFQRTILLLASVQILMLAYDPRTVLPTARDERAGQGLLALVRSFPGEVFIPSHSYYPALVGKPSHAHWAAITDTSGIWDTNLDVQRGGKNDPRREIIMDELRAAVARQRFDAIILDDYAAERHAFWDDLLAPYYELDRQVFADANVFWTVSGSPARPQLVYVPKRP